MQLLITDNRTLWENLSVILNVPFDITEGTFKNDKYILYYIPANLFKININNVGTKLIHIKNDYLDLLFTVQLIDSTPMKKLKHLLERIKFDSIINCCNSNAKGQGIFEMLKIFLKTEIEKTPKLERLWITEYNPDILQKQLDNLENNDKYIDLGKSHICELLLDEYWYYISDKITGQTKQKINLKEVFVLKVISDKEDTIAIHNGNDYFKIYVEMNGYKGNWYRKPNIDRVFSLDGVAAITEKLKNTSLYIMSTDQKIKTKEHPFLYNLNDILREASTLKKIPITKCKIALNNLYTKGYITNPNTTSRHLPSNYANYLLKILKHIAVLSQYKKYIDYIKVYAEINITDRVLNNNYVDNTHAIIPTPSTPKCVDLDSTEYFLYDLIIKRFLACFMKPFRKQTEKIIGSFDKDNFVKFENEIELHKGWTVVYDDKLDIPEYIKEIDKTEMHNIPVHSGQFVREFNIKIKDNTTRVPNRYSIASLMKLMETAGQNIKDDIKKINRRNLGIGRAEERPFIIKNMIDKNLIKSEDSKISLDAIGEQVMNEIPQELFSVELLTMFNTRIVQLEQGKTSVEEVIKEHVALLDNRLDHTEHVSHIFIDYLGIINKYDCPLCSSRLAERKQFIGCTNYPACHLSIPKQKSGYILTTRNIIDLITKHSTPEIKGFTFKNRGSREGRAKLILKEDGKIGFQF